MSSSLFDLQVSNADVAYENIRRANSPFEREIKNHLDALWRIYQPFADSGFVREFPNDPDGRFWEMYLTVELVRQGKNVRPRSELPTTVRDASPDIRIVEGGRTIWLEAIAPDIGELANLDRVPELVPINRGGSAQRAPRRQVELRISGALLQKTNAFQRYKERGLVGEQDVCLVAISGLRFFAQSASIGLTPAATAVYPLGNQFVTLDRDTFEQVDSGYHYSEEIGRSAATGIPRYAFLHDRFSKIGGLIWSRRSIGSFIGKSNDFVFVHNISAKNRLPTSWASWSEEDLVSQVGEERYELTTIGREAEAGR